MSNKFEPNWKYTIYLANEDGTPVPEELADWLFNKIIDLVEANDMCVIMTQVPYKEEDEE